MDSEHIKLGVKLETLRSVGTRGSEDKPLNKVPGLGVASSLMWVCEKVAKLLKGQCATSLSWQGWKCWAEQKLDTEKGLGTRGMLLRP